MKEKRLYRIEEGSKLFGVCGGIAEYFDIDPTVVRLVWAILILWAGFGVLAYIIAALIMPKKSEVVIVEKETKKKSTKKDE